MAKDIETAKRFLAMPRGARADALVGRYLGLFAFVEVGLNRLLAHFLNTDVASWTVMTRNMEFAAKVQSARALNSVYDRDGHFNGLNKRLMDHAKDRNLIAHSPFGPSRSSNGVTFMNFKANAKLEGVHDDWSVERMMKAYGELRDTATQLTAFAQRVEAYREALRLVRQQRSD